MTGAGAVAALVLLPWAVGVIGASAGVLSWSIVRRGHVRIVAWSAFALSLLAVAASWNASTTVAGGDVQRMLAATFVVACGVHLLAQYQESDRTATVVGCATGIVGAFALSATAGMLDGWSPLLSIPGLLAGAALLGLVTNGMLLGHWYLNQPGLQPWALARLTGAGLAVVVLSGAIGVAGATRLTDAATEGAALGLPGFGADFGPAFFIAWCGLILFTAAVLYGVRRCIAIRSIQSATGLYYVAILTAGVAEFLIRYLMVNSA